MQSLVNGAQALGFPLSPAQAQTFQRYADELITWNQRLNLTAITGPEDIRVKHFLDSLTCLQALRPPIAPPTAPRRVLDVGSGAGFPGLPLKIYDPSIHLTLLESAAKKARFLEGLVEHLGLTGVEVIADRAETLGQDPRYRETYDLVLARAVAELAVLSELCLPFCRIGGLFVAQKKAGIATEMKNAEGAIATLGGLLRQAIPVTLPTVAPRQLIVIEKVQATPSRYPRRPGLPAKRPLT